jgi:hypothetical protein
LSVKKPFQYTWLHHQIHKTSSFFYL